MIGTLLYNEVIYIKCIASPRTTGFEEISADFDGSQPLLDGSLRANWGIRPRSLKEGGHWPCDYTLYGITTVLELTELLDLAHSKKVDTGLCDYTLYGIITVLELSANWATIIMWLW